MVEFWDTVFQTRTEVSTENTISDISAIEKLDLRGKDLVELPDDISMFTNLWYLHLGNTRIAHLPDSFSELTKLEALDLGHTLFTSFPIVLTTLPKLDTLVLNHTKIDSIPRTISNLTHLRIIGLNHTDISELPIELTYLKKLEVLDLSYTAICEIPAEISNLSNLRRLILTGTQITSLPQSIEEMPLLNKVIIGGTPLEKEIPPEILSQPPKDIIRYIYKRRQSAALKSFNEAKLIIVGQPDVGKTCLMNRLVYDIYQDQPPTEGIEISAWNYLHNGEEYRLNVWDFGGQEIYHATHQFFMTSRSMYLMVWDTRAEEEYGRIDYWLKTIESLGGDSPIIIVVNKCDKSTGNIRKIVEREIKALYPQVTGLFYVSCKDDIGIKELRNHIIELSVHLPLMKTPELPEWDAVRRELEKMSASKNFISYERYLEICLSNEVDEETAISLAKYLHDLGVILYYHDDLILNSLVILSSKWGTDAVYKILDQQNKLLKGRNGVLNSSDLSKIWIDKKKYPSQYYTHLLQLMENFQLMFGIGNHSYLVAELLEEDPIELEWPSFPRNQSLSFRLQYDYLPAGIMTRFIVKMNSYLLLADKRRLCWRKGAYLNHRSTFALVKLFDRISERYISIQVNGGTKRDQQEMLTIIRTSFEELNKRFNKIVVTEQVPCICSESCRYMFNYTFLLLAEQKGKKTVECQNTADNVDLKKLLDGLDNRSDSVIWERLIINYPNTNSAFQSLCKDLFRLEYFDQDTIFQSDPNNAGVEIHPQKALNGAFRGEMISFQSKFFKGRIQYKNINDSAQITSKYYSGGLGIMILYCNKELKKESYEKTETDLKAKGITLVIIAEDELRNRIRKYPELMDRYFYV